MNLVWNAYAKAEAKAKGHLDEIHDVIAGVAGGTGNFVPMR
jgi:hypothetical protein